MNSSILPNALLSGDKLLTKIARNEASQLFSVRLSNLLAYAAIAEQALTLTPFNPRNCRNSSHLVNNFLL